MIAFLQILSSLPSVLGEVPWPTVFISFLVPFSSLNLDFISTFSSASCSLAVDFHYSFIVAMSIPLMMFLTVMFAYCIAGIINNRKEKLHRTIFLKKHIDVDSTITTTAAASTTTTNSNNNIKNMNIIINKRKLKGIEKKRAKVKKILFLGIQLLYPSLATRIFSMFRCDMIHGIPNKYYLVSDYSIDCNSTKHIIYSIVAVIFLFLYIIGVSCPFTLVLKLHFNNILHFPLFYFLLFTGTINNIYSII